MTGVKGTAGRWKLGDAFFAGLFFLLLGLPTVDSLFGLDWVKQSGENRTLAKAPSLSDMRQGLAVFVKTADTYFSDHFGFRNALIRNYDLIRYFVLRASPSDKVVLGGGDRLFFAGESNVTDYRSTELLPAEALAEWALSVKQRETWLAKRGIPFLFVVAPNAHTVYPEFLPSWMTRAASLSRLDQIGGEVSRRYGMDLLDLRAAMAAAKAKAQIYRTTDSHWNELGGYYGYVEIVNAMRKVQPEIAPPRPLEDFEVVQGLEPGGDLARMMGLEDLIREEVIHVRPREGLNFTVTEQSERGFSTLRNGSKPEEAGERILMFKDSYSIALVPFLSQHFRNVRYLSTHDFLTAEIDAFKPTFVIHETVERFLMRPPLVNPEDVRAVEL